MIQCQPRGVHMIEIESAKQELINYVKQQKIHNPRVIRKLDHIMRVVEISRKLAIDLKLTEEQVQLAELIGLLHDIGRFKQYQIFNENTNSIMLDTSEKFNHGEVGVEVLKKDNYIRKYMQEDKYDEIIYTAVYEHNRYELSQGLTKQKELFCKIIKDADKMDLIYEGVDIYWKQKEEIQEIEAGELSKEMLKDFYQHKLANNRNRVSKTDQILRFTSFVFDINFLYSFKVLKENNHINQMIDRFCYQLPETKVEMSKIKEIANQYIDKKIKMMSKEKDTYSNFS